jgi:SRSO17 transposase
MGCAGRVANGINTVHLSYVRERTGHALVGARQWIPVEHVNNPQASQRMRLPQGLEFRTKGQLAIDLCTEAYTDGVAFDFVCGDEVYGNCTGLRESFEQHGQAYVLRVASTFMLQLAAETKMTCAGGQAVRQEHAPVGGPLGRGRVERSALVRLDVDRHRLAPPPPAGPPSPARR